MINVLCLVQKAMDRAPNQRFRHEQWAPHLARDHGITLTFEPFESEALSAVLYHPGRRLRKAALVARDAVRRWRRRNRGRAFDAVVVVREAMLIGGPWIERSLARRRVPLIYDFDDAIWRWHLTGVNGVLSLARFPWKVARICRVASAVTVGNDFLAAYARRFNANVHIVRTSIDVDRYPAFPEPPATAPFTVVWTGSHSTLGHLDLARPVLERLATQRPLRVRVVCDRPPRPFHRAQLEYVPWRIASEASDLAEGHVGIMPLPDTDDARGKCGCKALQCMAIGRPVIVSPVGLNREIVTPDESGYWATTEDEWVRHLTSLADDAALRARMGAAGRRRVLGHFSADASARAFAAVIRQTLASRSGAPRALQ
jgi:glycosyltransferase involved in cell wall biosynthesis